MGKNVIIFGVDIRSSAHFDNKNKHNLNKDNLKKILILDEGPTEGLDDTTLTAEARDHINFTQPRERFVLSPHYNKATVSHLLMLQKCINSKQNTQK